MHLPYVDFPVTKSTTFGFAVQSVHSSICPIFVQTTNEQQPLFRTEEFGCFRPVDDEEFGDDGNDESGEAFNDEDPAPAIIPTDPSHFRQGICEKLQTGSGMAVRYGRVCLGTHPAPRPCQDDGREEQIEPPLELVSTVVHRHQVHAPCLL